LLPLGGAKVIFLDFGAVAELSPTMRRGIIEILQAALTRDTPRLIVAMKDMGFIARGADPEVFERVVDFFHDKFQAEVKLESLSLRELKLSPEKALSDLADLRKLNVSLRDLMQHFHVPKEWVLLERTLLLLLGLCTELAPELNPMQVIRPYVEEMVLGQDRDWSKFLVETTRDVVTHVAQLPGELRKFIARAQRGQLEVRFRGPQLPALTSHRRSRRSTYHRSESQRRPSPRARRRLRPSRRPIPPTSPPVTPAKDATAQSPRSGQRRSQDPGDRQSHRQAPSSRRRLAQRPGPAARRARHFDRARRPVWLCRLLLDHLGGLHLPNARRQHCHFIGDGAGFLSRRSCARAAPPCPPKCSRKDSSNRPAERDATVPTAHCSSPCTDSSRFYGLAVCGRCSWTVDPKLWCPRWSKPGGMVWSICPARSTRLPPPGPSWGRWREEALHHSDGVLIWLGDGAQADPWLHELWGSWQRSSRVVLGVPPDQAAPESASRLHLPVARSPGEAVEQALAMLRPGQSRRGGERTVPLLLWRSPRLCGLVSSAAQGRPPPRRCPARVVLSQPEAPVVRRFCGRCVPGSSSWESVGTRAARWSLAAPTSAPACSITQARAATRSIRWWPWFASIARRCATGWALD
jgi:hypothetical protein